jgi:ribosomal protein S18 acetylase RimI-like enzyme
MDLQIRPLTEYHRPDLERLIVGYDSQAQYRVIWEDSPQETVFRVVYEPLAAPLRKDWDMLEEDFARYRELIGQGHSLGAYLDGELVALSINEPFEWNRSLWIWEFHVAAQHQRKGIGRALMEANAALARQLNMRTLILEAANTNARAVAFYRSLGFALEGIEISRYTNHDLEPGGEVAFFMKRRIES